MVRQRATRAETQGKHFESYAPIAHSLLVMDEREQRRMKHRFEICYMMARESMVFMKYPSLCALAERQGVGLGSSS